MSGAARLASALLALALAAGCAASGGPGAARTGAPRPQPTAPLPDSVTLALWRLDENGGTRAADAGPFRLEGVAGLDTRTDFGRWRGARVFERSSDSFVYVPYNPTLESAGSFTVEAWIYVNSVSPYELQVIAARWSPVANMQSWVLGVSGLNESFPAVTTNSPAWFTTILGMAPVQRLVFGYQPSQAGGVRGYFSTTELPLQRWVQVAATVDGETVRLYVDGRSDAQYVAPGGIRHSEAPLLLGDCFDTRYLTNFSGELRVDPSANVSHFYQFDGSIDEVRLSNTARRQFESLPMP